MNAFIPVRSFNLEIRDDTNAEGLHHVSILPLLVGNSHGSDAIVIWLSCRCAFLGVLLMSQILPKDT